MDYSELIKSRFCVRRGYVKDSSMSRRIYSSKIAIEKSYLSFKALMASPSSKTNFLYLSPDW